MKLAGKQHGKTNFPVDVLGTECGTDSDTDSSSDSSDSGLFSGTKVPGPDGGASGEDDFPGVSDL